MTATRIRREKGLGLAVAAWILTTVAALLRTDAVNAAAAAALSIRHGAV
jgi:hypothetical protein